jgi:hypothetical protein
MDWVAGFYIEGILYNASAHGRKVLRVKPGAKHPVWKTQNIGRDHLC